MSGLGLLALRLVLATVLLAHGSHTMFGSFGGPGVGPGGLSQEAIRLSNSGMEPGYLMAVLAGVIQLAGGLLIAAGWMTRWAAAAVGLLVLIQIWTLHLAWGFFLNWTGDPVRGHGVEYALVLLGALLCLAVGGAGDLSVDGRRLRQADSLALQRARIRRKF